MRLARGLAGLLACALAGASPSAGRAEEAGGPAPAAPPSAGAAAGPSLPARGAPAPTTARASLVLGEFRLAADPVVDGDTFRIATPKGNVRVQSVDAEEVFHDRKDRDAAAADFPAYARSKRGVARVPVKFGTPAGEEAKAFARHVLEGVASVRLEVDEPGLDRDAYGRTLAHVFFVGKDAKEVLYGEALVRAGLSPYFVKYGRSRRFHARFAAAEDEARAAKRGIWGDALPHYPDYAERLVWWRERAAQVDAWILESEGPPARPDHVRLGLPTDLDRVPSLLGRTVTVFGTLDREEGGDAATPSSATPPGVPPAGPEPRASRAPRRLMLVAGPHDSFPVVVFDDAVWAALDHGAISRRFVRVTGTLSEYRGRPQVILRAAQDLSTR